MATELVGIELELRGEEGVFRDLEKLDRMLSGFSGAKGKKTIEFDLGQSKQRLLELRGEMHEVEDAVERYRKRLREARKELRDMRKDESATADEIEAQRNAVDKATDALDEQRDALKELKAEYKEVEQRVNELRYALRNFSQMSFGQMFKTISTGIKHAGQNLQTLGNTLSRVGSPFERFTSGMVMGVGYKVLNKFTEGLSSGFDRMDILNKYSRNLQMNFGKTADEAKLLRDNLNEAVEGLPTGLDEIVNMANQFTASMGDADRAAKLAIATNNAFLASQTNEAARYQGMMQLRDVIGGKDMNAREWQSLAASMLPAIRMIGEEMGYTGEKLNEYVQSVQSGEIANEEFLDQLIKYGTSGKIVETARLAMDTWEAFFSRIGTAASRLTYGVLTSLDELVNTATGGAFKSLNMFLDSLVIPKINELSASIQDWIKAHPEEIIDFFNQLKQIDWAGFGKGMVDGLGAIKDVMTGLVGAFGDKGMERLGFFLTIASPLGRAITLIGGVLKGLSHPLGLILAALAKGGLMASGELKKGGIIGALGRLLGGEKGGLIGNLFKKFSGSKGALDEAGDVAKSVPTVAGSFRNMFSALEGLMKASGSILLVAGTGFVAFEAAKHILQDIKSMSDMLNEGDWSNAPIVATGVIAGIGAFIEIFNYIGTALGSKGLLATAIASAASFLVTGTFAADMWAIKTGVIQIRDTITTLDEIATSIQTMQGIGTLGEDVKEKFRSTIDAINEIKNMFVGKNGGKMDRGQVEAGLPTFSIGKVTALTNIGDAVKQLQTIATQLNSLSAITVSDPSQVIEDIKKACNSLQGIKASKGLATQTETIANSVLQIRRIAYHINKLAGLSVNAGGFADTIAQIKEALEAIKGMNQTVTLDIKVVMGSGFRSSVNGVVKQLKDAKKKIEKYKDGISFTIPVKVTYRLSDNFRGIIETINGRKNAIARASGSGGTQKYSSPIGPSPRGSSTGGLIYRALGGEINWKPQGTDKIPAMLTEGEYVQRKQAVDLFGLDFMRKVNNLDVKGAMSALLSKVGTTMSAGRQSIVNNTVNNNQRITQNINTNNPNFAGARMGRFVGAL